MKALDASVAGPRGLLVGLGAAALLASCAGQADLVGKGGGASTRALASPPPLGFLAGSVRALAGIVANNPASRGGGIITDNGLLFRTLALAEHPLPGATVALRDGSGAPLPGVPPVKTDASGAFRFDALPAGQTYRVLVPVLSPAGKPTALQAFSRVGSAAEVTVPSTLVASYLLAGRRAGPGPADLQAFRRAVDATARGLEGRTLPELSDGRAVLAFMDSLSGQVAELRTELQGLRGELARVEADLAAIKQQIATGASAAPSPPVSPPPAEKLAVETVSRLGPNGELTLQQPWGLAVSAGGDLYLADWKTRLVQRLASDGTLTTVAGTGEEGLTDGPGASARFNKPTGMALDPAGDLVVADAGNHAIRRIGLRDPAHPVTTIAGDGVPGYVDGRHARFRSPIGVAVGPAGEIYVADSDNNRIRVVGPDGLVSTLAGSGRAGRDDGPGAAATFRQPFHVARAADGSLYVAELQGRDVRRVAPGGAVTLVAGSGEDGPVDGVGADARFTGPTCLALDGAGDLYVGDERRLRKVALHDPAGPRVTTLGGGGTDAQGVSIRFLGLFGLAFDPQGRLLMSDGWGIRRVSLP